MTAYFSEFKIKVARFYQFLLLLLVLVFAAAATASADSKDQSHAQAPAPSSTDGKWTAGFVGMATLDQNWQSMALPWLSYQTSSYVINPLGVSLIGERNAFHWQAGLELDYDELFSDPERGFLGKGSGQYYWGPLRFAGFASVRLTDPMDNWQWRSTVGSQLPIGPGMFGAEFGFTSESEQWDNSESDVGEVEVARSEALKPLAGLQYGVESGDWQIMFMAQYQSSATERAIKQTYTWLVMKAW